MKRHTISVPTPLHERLDRLRHELAPGLIPLTWPRLLERLARRVESSSADPLADALDSLERNAHDG